MPESSVVIIGAGVAGLSCALRLQERGIPYLLLEASDRPGGRIRTDRVEGFLLDRGFQVLLTAYPECRRLLDYHALDLRCFESGAKVFADGGLQTVSDPTRTPSGALSSVFSSVGNMLDKLRVIRLRNHVMRGSVQSTLSNPEQSTIAELKEWQFSSLMIERFFRPFLGGIFLESELSTSSRKFEFVFRMFAEGEAALPAQGMGAIPLQLASRLPPDRIRYQTRVTAVDGAAVTTESGQRWDARATVIAADRPEAMRLLGRDEATPANSTCSLFFDAPQPPVSGPWLVLNGEGSGPVNTLCVPSEVSSTYAPAGRALVCASTIGIPPVDDMTLERTVRRQLDAWFGSTRDWRLLRIYRIPFALPAQPSGALSPVSKQIRVADGLFIAGDHTDLAGTNGAMLSGRRVADAIAP